MEEGRFPVVCNENTEDAVIPKSMHLGTLYNAAVVRDVNPVGPAGETPQVTVPVDTDWASLSQVEAKELKTLLGKHEGVFSSHDQDFGFTDNVIHRIETDDAMPFHKRHRPLPASQYQAVRDPHSLVLSGKGQATRRRGIKSYVHQHQMQLKTARAVAMRNAEAAAVERRALQAHEVFEKPLGVGQCVLVGRHGLRGRAKIADYWEDIIALQKKTREDSVLRILCPLGVQS